MWNKQRYCWQLQNHVRIANFREGTEKLPFPQNLGISSWSYDMAGHAKKCVERYRELANKTTQQLYKVSTPCIDDHHFKEEEMKLVGVLSQVCSRIVLKCFYLARIGRLDILWSVNKLARAVTKGTKACETPESIDFLQSSHKRIETLLSCGTHCQTMQTGTVSRLWLRRRSWGFKIYFRWNIVRFLEVIHLLQLVGCVRNRHQFLTAQQNLKLSLWTQDWDWMVLPHLIYGIWSLQFLETRVRTIQNRATS